MPNKIEVAKNVIKSKFTKRAIKLVALKILIPTIIMLLLVGFFYSIIDTIVSTVKDAITSCAESISNWMIESNKNGKINISDDEIDKFIAEIEKSGNSLQSMGMALEEDATKSEEEKARYYIRDFVTANLVTKTMYSGETAGDNEALGGICLQRVSAKDGSTSTLSLADGDGTVDSMDEYGVDDSGNVTYMGADDSIQTLNLSTCSAQEIPIMFFVDICVDTQNPEYAKALADYIIENSKTDKHYMTVTILDSYTDTTTKTTTTTLDSDTHESTTTEATTEETTGYSKPIVTKLYGLLYELGQTCPGSNKVENLTHDEYNYNTTTIETDTRTIDYSFSQPTVTDPIIYSSKDEATNPFYKMTITKYDVINYKVKKDAYSTLIDSGDILFDFMDKNLDNDTLEQTLKYILYKWSGINFGVTELDNSLFDLSKFMSVGGSGGTLSVTECNISRDEFIADLQAFGKKHNISSSFLDDPGTVYDVCVKNNINPVLCAAQADLEQGLKNMSSFNYWGIGHKTYSSLANGVQGYCEQIQSMQEGGSQYSFYQKRTKELATVDSEHFTGNSLYVFFSAYCVQLPGEPAAVTNEERASVTVTYVDDVVKCAENIFGTGVLSATSGGASQGGITNDAEAQQLEKIIETQWLGTKIHTNGSYQNGIISPYWLKGGIGNNTCSAYQCTWWVLGRANMYLNDYGTKYKTYPRNGNVGNGGEWYDKNKNNGWFQYRNYTKTKFNCLLEKGWRLWACGLCRRSYIRWYIYKSSRRRSFLVWNKQKRFKWYIQL